MKFDLRVHVITFTDNLMPGRRLICSKQTQVAEISGRLRLTSLMYIYVNSLELVSTGCEGFDFTVFAWKGPGNINSQNKKWTRTEPSKSLQSLAVFIKIWC